MFSWILGFALHLNVARAGCNTDVECKGDRICQDSVCVQPAGSPAVATVASPVAPVAAAAVAGSRCPFPVIETVRSTMTSVTINGQFYAVRGLDARSNLESTLLECNQVKAATLFKRWRADRRATNITGITGLLVFWPLLIVTPITAISAGTNRLAMERALSGQPSDDLMD